MNPNFFKGTVVESQVQKFLAEDSYANGACSVA
jgi:hypothetical protein